MTDDGKSRGDEKDDGEGAGNEPKDESKAKGGHARAEALTPEQRSIIAAKAAATRWSSGKPLRALHRGNFEKDFGIDVDCYVLDDVQKTAVISQRGMAAALGLGQGSGANLQRFVKGKKIAPLLGAELRQKLENPVRFQWSLRGVEGARAETYGYDATILIDICKVVIRADDEGMLLDRQKAAARQAHVIVNASAKWGIRDLVYRLAGYDATKDEAIAAFKFYVREEAREYEKEFPDQLYKEWYRLYKITPPARNKPWKFKNLTVDHVYVPLAKSSGKVLRLTRDRKAASGERWRRLHQFLSDVGVKVLRTHLGRLLGMAEVSRDKDEYERHVQRVFYGQTDLLDVTPPDAP